MIFETVSLKYGIEMTVGFWLALDWFWNLDYWKGLWNGLVGTRTGWQSPSFRGGAAEISIKSESLLKCCLENDELKTSAILFELSRKGWFMLSKWVSKEEIVI